MPRGDGTGPMGAGRETGRGMGGGGGMGKGQGRGRGRIGDFAIGPGGNYVCPKCGKTVPHQQGVSCSQVKCPACGAAMIRQQ